MLHRQDEEYHRAPRSRLDPYAATARQLAERAAAREAS
jgi:hypothetical protein